MDSNQLMTIDEVALYLRVKKRTVYDWLKKDKIPAIKTVGQWRFKKETIDSWLEAQQRFINQIRVEKEGQDKGEQHGGFRG
ncbi:MAG TPA: helix-turn-helix domain-containing protein [Candidatus Omnitrophota bacterium]|jgi:excisionase family DNA binding protein|nr:helix-turn-helix domain-containing protein [Candidatus Omnitrophota bacterium]